MSLRDENLINCLTMFGDLTITRKKNSENYRVEVVVDFGKWRVRTFIEEDRMLDLAVDRCILKALWAVRDESVILGQRSEKFKGLFFNVKEELKAIGEWDRLVHPDYYRKQMLEKKWFKSEDEKDIEEAEDEELEELEKEDEK